MKFVLCFLALVVPAQFAMFTPPVRNIGDIGDSVRKFIIDEGYHAQVYTVQTEDGYKIDMVRIPHAREEVTEEYLAEASMNGDDSQENQQKPAVLLMPGMMSTYEDFVIGGPSEGLAFKLADHGYDVYIGNARGSFFGQKHTTLDPERDSIFWNYCWHDIGVKDLPAIIDKVIRVSGQEKIDYIGHMEGTTAFYVLATVKPEYNNKINKMVSLGPIAYMKHTKNEFIKELDSRIVDQEINILQNTQNKQSNDVWTSGWLKRYVGVNSYTWNSEIIINIEDKCKSEGYDDEICSNVYFLINGYNSRNYNMTTVRRAIPRVPSPAPSKSVLHYVQSMNSGRFQWYNSTFDRHNEQPGKVYDLSKVTVPVAIFYAPNDVWSQEEDVQHLIRHIPNVVYSGRADGISNNMDFIYGRNDASRVHESVMQLLKQRVQRSHVDSMIPRMMYD